ncbi:MAG: helix-turn-helix transcriptional regulator, partial [Ktedonobacteraceae bacterium]|nr:helix-turn-helix transcriptional regulator [Ktedonobacteraceae bacterium]
MDWREFLSSIIASQAEHDRIASDIGVHSVTLSRWMSGESSPRPHNMRQLLRALPKSQRHELQTLLEKASLDVSDLEIDTPVQE